MTLKKRATIREVAHLAKVSMMTASRVINNSPTVDEMARKRVLEAIKALKYQPNLAARELSKHRGKSRNLSPALRQIQGVVEIDKHYPAYDAQLLPKRRTNAVGIIIPFHRFPLIIDYFLRILHGLEEAAYDNAYDIIIHDCPQKKDGRKLDYINIFNSKLLEGLIIIAPPVEDRTSIEKLISLKVPLILVGSRDNMFNFIDSDNIDGAKKIVKHLIEQGHKRIATITGNLKMTNAVDRLNGYKEILKENSLSYDPSIVVSGEFESEEGYQAMKRLLKTNPRPTAVFCANDATASMAIRACTENKVKVPENISIVGYDDSDFAVSLQPQLTTVRQPCYEMGYNTFESLLQIINGKKERVQLILPNKIIFRQSCCLTHSKLP